MGEVKCHSAIKFLLRTKYKPPVTKITIIIFKIIKSLLAEGFSSDSRDNNLSTATGKKVSISQACPCPGSYAKSMI
ncbi:MAG TPA: hypothetical protein PL110_05475, partial [Candidatus Eremiobacteraeota bacterium]|nr:hypothetical protein [Candidatus Eremiobacteraeota bacterium]